MRVGGIDRQSEIHGIWAVGIFHQRQQDPLIEQARLDGFHLGDITAHEGKDRGGEGVGFDIERVEDAADKLNISMEMGMDGIIVHQDIEGFKPGGDEWWRSRGGASVGDGGLSCRFDGLGMAHDDAAGTAEPFGEGGGDDELIAIEMEMVCDAPSVIAQHAKAMAIIEQQPVILAEDARKRLGGGEIAIGGEDGIGHDDHRRVDGFEQALSMGCFEVVIEMDVHRGELGGILETGMGSLVDDGVLYAERFESLECGEVGRVAIGDEEPGFMLAVLGELGFELGVRAGVAGGFSACRTREPVSSDRVLDSLDDSWMVGEPEVVAAAEREVLGVSSADGGGGARI